MSKAVVYALIATALFFFIILSPMNQQERRGVGLNRRFGFEIRDRVPSFDPLVTKIEREADKQGLRNSATAAAGLNNLGNNKLVSEVAETYQYLTSAGKLNTTLRLIILFPLLDREPKDGVITFNELEAWLAQQAMERLDFVTQTELKAKDKDGDFSISFREYLPQFSDKDLGENGTGHGEAGWWHERFALADTDNDGLLQFSEFKDFLHPEDSENQELLKWLLRDRLERIDDETDGKLNFKEFLDHVYKTYHSYVEFETSGRDVPSAEEKFAELDVNKDQFLSEEELIPIIHYFYPGELSFARYYTRYLMNEADDNEDGKLSLQEILSHEFIFYNTIHAGGHEDSDDDHDEL